MPVFKVMIDGKALRRLAETAVAERRPLDLQAEVLVLRQLGCWPHDDRSDDGTISVKATADEGNSHG